MEQLEKELQQLRSDMMGVVDKMVEPVMIHTREMSMVKTKAQEAQMHFGNALKFYTDSTPYQESMNPDTNNIDPVHRDKEVKPFEVPYIWTLKETTRIQKLKSLRVELECILERITVLMKKYGTYFDNEWAQVCLMMAGMRIIECRNWIGMELGRLRDITI